jgi:hypothetical protein
MIVGIVASVVPLIGADPNTTLGPTSEAVVLPNSTNGELKKLWKKAVPYKHQAVFQNQQSYGDGWVHPISWLPGADRIDPKRLAKRSNPHEFPWVHTAGFEQTTSKYVSIPEDQHIEYRDLRGAIVDHGDTERVHEWRYPVGTVFIETLVTHGRVFEVRTRTKGSDGSWRANVYRPYADAKDLQAKLLKLGTRDAKALAAAIDNLPRSYSEIKNPHPVKTFEFKGHREDLPDIPESLAEEILGWDFVANAEWKTDCFAPSTKSDRLSIVAKDYQGFMVRPDSKGCAQCHDTTLAHVSHLEPSRDWYGRVRGSDGIFSFHIFDEDTLSVEAYDKAKAIKVSKSLPLKHVEKFTLPGVQNNVKYRNAP